MQLSTKLLALSPATLLGYWPLWEPSGALAADLSGNGYDGAVTGAAFGATGIGDGHTALTCDGSGDYVDIYSAGLGAAFDGDAGTVLLWIKTNAWDDGSPRYALYIYADADNFLFVYKLGAGGDLITYRMAGGTALYETVDTGGVATWLCLALTWSHSADEQKTYLNGVQMGTTLTGLGAWSGAPSSMKISRTSTAAWSGVLAHVALWDSVLSDIEIVSLSNAEGAIAAIADRTQTDLNTRTAKAFFNVADWQRIDGNSQFLKALLDDRYTITVDRTATTEPAAGDFADVDEINALAGNIEALRVAANFLPASVGLVAVKDDYDTGVGAVAPDYETVNDWERNLALIDEYVYHAEDYYPIYGVSWDGGSDPTLTRTDDAVGMTAAAGVDSTPVTNDFDTAQIFGDITEVTDTSGNVFVRIPRFYIEKTVDGAARTWRISKVPHAAGWYLPACFWDFTTSEPLDSIDVGKYVGSVSGTRLYSKANTYPTVQTSMADFRGKAEANGAGYHLLDLHIVDVLQTLFRVEFATLDCQTIMAGFTAGTYTSAHTASITENGVNRIVIANAYAALYAVGQAISVGTSLGGNQVLYGRTITSIDTYDASHKALTFDGAAVDIAAGNILYNTGWKNGFSSGIVASSGSLTSNSSGLYPLCYRGIENVYGNVEQVIDGVNISSLQPWVCLDADDYGTGIVGAPYVDLDHTIVAADGYVDVTGFDAAYPFAEFPTSAGGAGATYYGDYSVRLSSLRVAAQGQWWFRGAWAGLAGWDFTLEATDATRSYLGARLVRKGA